MSLIRRKQERYLRQCAEMRARNLKLPTGEPKIYLCRLRRVEKRLAREERELRSEHEARAYSIPSSWLAIERWFELYGPLPSSWGKAHRSKRSRWGLGNDAPRHRY